MKTALYFPRYAGVIQLLQCSILLLLPLSLLTAQETTPPLDVQTVLEDFGADYLRDPHFKQDRTFGVRVDDREWTVTAVAPDGETEGKIEVRTGAPATPTFYFVTTEWALRDIAAGRMNALTGAVRAFSTDYAPFDLEMMEGFEPAPDFTGDLLPFLFHFWTRGAPEIIPFGPRHTRNTHGMQATVLYYQPGFRSGYGILFPGQHANEHPRSQTNEFPSLFIIVKGTVTARLDGQDHEIPAGNAIFVPPGMRHEFLNPYEEPVEFVLVMFGEGA